MPLHGTQYNPLEEKPAIVASSSSPQAIYIYVAIFAGMQAKKSILSYQIKNDKSCELQI